MARRLEGEPSGLDMIHIRAELQVSALVIPTNSETSVSHVIYDDLVGHSNTVTFTHPGRCTMPARRVSFTLHSRNQTQI